MLKKLIVAAILIIIVGIGGSILTYTATNKSIEINESQSTNYEKIDAIQINTVSTDVEIIASKDQSEAHIQLQGKTKQKKSPVLTVKEEGSKLIINVETQEGINQWFQLSPNFAPDTLALKLYVPEKLLNNITFVGVSADLYIENMQADTMSFSSTSGDIEAYTLQLGSAEIETISGDVEIDELVGDITISTTSGDIDGYDLQSESTKIETNSGKIAIDDLVGSVSVITTSGDITLGMIDLSHPIQIDSTSGNVEILTESEPTDVNFNINSLSGDINILDEYRGSAAIGKASTLVEIETASGDILVE